jgi:cysteinyl-tRNA synthetase, unknown class
MRRGALAITVTASVASALTIGAACNPRSSASEGALSDPQPRARARARAEAQTPIDGGGSSSIASTSARVTQAVGPGFAVSGPWVSFYGSAAEMGDLARVARTYRIINLDADPGAGNFTEAQLRVLEAGGKNVVLSYFNVGACEHYRTYWSSAPPGFVACGANRAAQRGPYDGYPDETWMDPADAAYQRLLLEHVAPRLASRVDGFYLDNLELLEHPAMSTNGPCSASCRQGGLDFVRRLRERFPGHLIVMQNATSDVTRAGTTGGVPFATLLDGVAHEEVYAPRYDENAETELLAWKAMGLASRSGRPFWIAVEDYAGACDNRRVAQAALAKARARSFSPYVSDESGAQKTVCYWE